MEATRHRACKPGGHWFERQCGFRYPSHVPAMYLQKKIGVEKIDSINKKLDPNFNQAMLEIEGTQKQAGTIVQEIQKGYTMKGRLLRPALVGVAKSNDKKENDQKNEQNIEKNK